jgi:hypothetical protein
VKKYDKKFAKQFESTYSTVTFSNNSKLQTDWLKTLRFASILEAELFYGIYSETEYIKLILSGLSGPKFIKPNRTIISSIQRSARRIASLYYETNKKFSEDKLFLGRFSQENFEDYLNWSLVWDEDGITFSMPKNRQDIRYNEISQFMNTKGFDSKIIKGMINSFGELGYYANEYVESYLSFLKNIKINNSSQRLREMLWCMYAILGWLNRWGALFTYIVEVENKDFEWG